MIKFGDRLKQLRTERLMSQELLAKHFNTGKASICNYEKNIRLPDANVIAMYAKFFDVTIDYIMGITENRKECIQLPDKYTAIILKAKESNITPEKLDRLIEILRDG